MDKKLINYAGIVAIVVSIPGLLQMNDMTTGIVVCLVGLILTFYLYKKYTDEVADKTQNTVGQGVKYGLVIGVLITIISLINVFVLMDMEVLRASQIEALEPFADMMGEEAYDMAVQNIENLSDDEIRNSQLFGSFGAILFGLIIGLISGLIFKYRDDEE